MMVAPPLARARLDVPFRVQRRVPCANSTTLRDRRLRRRTVCCRTLPFDGYDDRRAGRAAVDDDIYLPERIANAVPQGLHGILEQAGTFDALHP